MQEQEQELGIEERNHWLDTMADLDRKFDRRYEALSKRIAQLEDGNRGSSMFLDHDERKMLVTLFLVYVGVTIVLPALREVIVEWRSGS